MSYRVGLLTFLLTGVLHVLVIAQSQIFVPLKFSFPDSILSTPKTYVYKNAVSGVLRYRDVILIRKENQVIIHWKEYDKSNLADSSTEINGKSFDRYMMMDGQATKATITEDSVYQNDTRYGERVQTLFYNLSSTISLFETVHSTFLKDTTISWHDKPIPCIVTQSFYRQKLGNSLFPETSKEVTGVVYHYYGKNVGLLMYRSEMDNENSTWLLVDIRERNGSNSY